MQGLLSEGRMEEQSQGLSEPSQYLPGGLCKDGHQRQHFTLAYLIAVDEQRATQGKELCFWKN